MTDTQQSPPSSLMKQVEQLVESIESGSGNPSVVALASRVVEQFGDELGLTGGRIFEREGSDYVLVAGFPDAARELPVVRVPVTYPPVARVLERGFVFMSPGDTGVDPEIEARLGAKEFAAISVHKEEQESILSFDVAPGSQSDDIRYSLSILRHSINHRLRESWLGNVFREARMIQTSILPREAPEFGDFDVAGHSDPMEVVGGDFFDFIRVSPKILGLAIADVSGHGLPAALLVRDVYMGLRMGLSHDFKILRTVERLNDIVSRGALTSRFVSLFYGELEENGNFIYVNAGHPPPLHLRPNGQVRRLRRGGPVLGPLPGTEYERGFARLRRGDSLVLFSDGIVETLGATEDGVEEYGDRRLISQLGAAGHLPAARAVRDVFEDVAEFSGAQAPIDDRTLVVVKRPVKP